MSRHREAKDPSPRRSSWAGAALRLALLGVLVALALHFVDFGLLWRALRACPPAGLLLLLCIATVDRWLMAAKWFHLCRTFTTRLRLLSVVRAYYVASFLNYSLPSTIGGDIYRGVVVAQENPGNKEHVYASLIMEKVVGMVATILWAWVGFFYLLAAFDDPLLATVLWVLIAVSLTVLVALALSLHRGVHPLLVRGLHRVGLGRIAAFVEKVFRAYLDFAGQRGILLRNLGLAAVENGVQVAQIWYAGQLLRLEVPAVDFLAIIVVAQMVRRFAMYLDVLAFSEALAIATYGLIGISPSLGLGISVLSHGAHFVAVAPGGLLLLFSRTRKELANAEAKR